MSSSKLKHDKGKKKRKSNDRREPAKPTTSKVAEDDIRRGRSSSVRSTPETRCNMNIHLVMSKKSGNWYLHGDSSLDHVFHTAIVPETVLLAEDDLSDHQHYMLNLMHNMQVSESTIANVMTQWLNDEGKKGEFLPQAIKRISARTQKAIDSISGISADMSVAEKTLEKSNRCMFHIVNVYIRQ